MMRDDKLWKWFSIYIRLRDSDDNGYCKCFTCGRVKFWREGDCGHGIGRQYLPTKYHEKNNHFQCKFCNGLDEGKKDVYKDEVNKRYGANTWISLELQKRQKFTWSGFEIEALTEHYKKEVHSLLKQKNLSLK
jgi:hypothetical protein